MNHKTILGIALLAALWGVPTTGGISGEEPARRNSTTLTIVAKAAKKSFQTDEPVILAIALANFGDKSVYVPVAESQVFEPSFRVKDANGVVIPGAAIDDPNRTVPPHYYVQREGKRVLMSPVLEVKARGLLLTFIPNALKSYRQRLAPGRYYLEPSGFPMILDARSVMSRPDYPNQLWVEATSTASVTTLVKHEPIEIVIESPTGR
jgi:hypothetical protein